MTYAMVGGILLNIGAYLTYKGKIFYSVIVYLVADICWVMMAYEREDVFGVISIIIGVTFGFLTFLKMKNGKFSKDLSREDI